MGLTEIVAQIQNSDWDKGKEVAKALSDALKDSETASQTKQKELEQQLETILVVTEAEGNDNQEKAKDAAKKIGQLTQQVQTLTTELEQSKSEVASIQKERLFSQVKEKSAVNTNVLKTLLKDEDKVEVGGDKVTVNGTDIKDWANNNHSDFMAALFPSTNQTADLPDGGSAGDASNDLPDGGSSGGEEKKSTADYIDRKYNQERVKNLISAV